MTKEKRQRFAIEFKSIPGKDGKQYLVLKTAEGSFHVFKEVEAKQAARECGANEGPNTRAMWKSLWNK